MRLGPGHRLPRAGIDPITSHDDALVTVAMAVHRPLRHETIVVLLDDERRGLALVVVTDTTCPDDVLEAVECLTRPTTHAGRAGAIVVGSVRPSQPGRRDVDADADRDVERWLELSEIAEGHGVELLEWFVLGAEVRCPRDDLGEAPRW
jgi:hypothetical protein